MASVNIEQSLANRSITKYLEKTRDFNTQENIQTISLGLKVSTQNLYCLGFHKVVFWDPSYIWSIQPRCLKLDLLQWLSSPMTRRFWPHITAWREPQKICKKNVNKIQQWLTDCRMEANENKSVYLSFTSKQGNCPQSC